MITKSCIPLSCRLKGFMTSVGAGGGYIGLEFGQMFRRFGSEVTIIQSAARLMMIEDEDVSDEVAAILRDDRITVLTSSTSVRVEPAGGGRLRLTVRTQDGERQLEGSHLLSAMADAIFTHPLLAEGLNALFATFDA